MMLAAAVATGGNTSSRDDNVEMVNDVQEKHKGEKRRGLLPQRLRIIFPDQYRMTSIGRLHMK